MRSSARTVEVAPNTVMSLLRAAGRASATFHDQHVRSVKAKRVQADETWSFIYAKQAKVGSAKNPPPEAGDVWTWVAIDSDTKLIISYHIGGRGLDDARIFMKDLTSRLAGRVELTTDAHAAYPEAIREAFADAHDVDYETSPSNKQFRGAPEPHHAHAHEALRPPDQRPLQEVRTTSTRFTSTPFGTMVPHSRDDPLHPWRPGSRTRCVTWSGSRCSAASDGSCGRGSVGS